MAILLRKNNAPVNTSPPTLVGSPEIGRVLFLLPGTWTSADQWTRREYEWYKNGVLIDGETRPTYLVREGDLGATITGKEIYTNFTGQSTGVVTSGVVGIAQTTLTDVAPDDFGMKSLQTTGSITSGTNTLTVASAAGFEIGDRIIVETGTEPGLGVRGTVGVGGTWPAVAYANAAARTADTSKPNNTYAYDINTGFVYLWTNSAWTQPYSGDYYRGTAQPKALVTTITNIVGNVLTLAATASATATSANVYFDNYTVWQAACYIDLLPQPAAYADLYIYLKRVTFPAGTYAFSDVVALPSFTQAVLQGAGVELTHFKSPNGTLPLSFFIAGASADGKFLHIRDIHFESNFGDEGFYLKSETFANSNNPGLPRVLSFQNTQYHTVESCKFTNPATSSISTGTCSYVYAYDCETVSDDGHQYYLQWQYQFADGTQCGAWDCSVTSAYMFGGFETFRSTYCQFVRCEGTNAGFSTESSGGFFIDTCSVTITANSQKTSTFWSRLSPTFAVSDNIGGGFTSLGGWIRNPTVTHAAYYNANQDILGCINVSPSYTASNAATVLVSGGYPLNPSAGGLFTMPDYVTPVNEVTGVGPQVISCDDEVLVWGVRANFSPNPAGARYSAIAFPGGGNGRVVQCVADSIVALSVESCQTNAEYEA